MGANDLSSIIARLRRDLVKTEDAAKFFKGQYDKNKNGSHEIASLHKNMMEEKRRNAIRLKASIKEFEAIRDSKAKAEEMRGRIQREQSRRAGR